MYQNYACVLGKRDENIHSTFYCKSKLSPPTVLPVTKSVKSDQKFVFGIAYQNSDPQRGTYG